MQHRLPLEAHCAEIEVTTWRTYHVLCGNCRKLPKVTRISAECCVASNLKRCVPTIFRQSSQEEVPEYIVWCSLIQILGSDLDPRGALEYLINDSCDIAFTPGTSCAQCVAAPNAAHASMEHYKHTTSRSNCCTGLEGYLYSGHTRLCKNDASSTLLAFRSDLSRGPFPVLPCRDFTVIRAWRACHWRLRLAPAPR